jgi:predicted RNA-binding Zn-ribbon protein involved in translation (DUF1610 family)
MENVEAHKWYFLVECARCKRGTAFSEAPSPEEEPAPMMEAFSWKCPHCGDERIYQPEQVQRGQGLYRQ